MLLITVDRLFHLIATQCAHDSCSNSKRDQPLEERCFQKLVSRTAKVVYFRIWSGFILSMLMKIGRVDIPEIL